MYLVNMLLILAGIGVLLVLLGKAWDIYDELKEDIRLMKKLDQQILQIGFGSFMFAGAMKLSWMTKFPPSEFFGDTFLGVGSSLTALGLTKLYKVQAAKKEKKLG